RPVASRARAAVRLIMPCPCVVVRTEAMGIAGTALGMAIGGAGQLVCPLVVAQRGVLRSLSTLWPRRQMLGQLAAYAAGFAGARAVETLIPGYAGLGVALVAGSGSYLAALVAVGGLQARD